MMRAISGTRRALFIAAILLLLADPFSTFADEIAAPVAIGYEADSAPRQTRLLGEDAGVGKRLGGGFSVSFGGGAYFSLDTSLVSSLTQNWRFGGEFSIAFDIGGVFKDTLSVGAGASEVTRSRISLDAPPGATPPLQPGWGFELRAREAALFRIARDAGGNSYYLGPSVGFLWSPKRSYGSVESSKDLILCGAFEGNYSETLYYSVEFGYGWRLAEGGGFFSESVSAGVRF